MKHKLYRYAKSILGDADEAKDVVQETLLKAWEKRNEIHQYKSLGDWKVKKVARCPATS